MKTNTLALALLLAFCCAARAQVVRGPYLQCPTPAGIKVKWRTAQPSVSAVSVGTTPGGLTMHFGDSALTTEHTVHVTGLAAHTDYFYAVHAPGGTVSGPGYRFRTFPAAGSEQPFRVWAIGDFGKGNAEQKRVKDAFMQYSTAGRPDVWLWLGDNVYPDGKDNEYQAYVFDSVYGYKNIMSWLPFMPTPGNHDYNTISPVTGSVAPLQQTGPYYDIVDVPTQGEAGGLASGNELYYSYDYGNVHFVSLNSELGSLYNAGHDWIGIHLFSSFNGSPMMTWLKQDLAANTRLWTVVYFHQPPYTDGSHDAEAFWEVYMKAMREHFTPVLEQYGVDLVLCGHSHVYERSYLMEGFHGNLSSFNPATMILQSTGGSDATGGRYVKYTDGPMAGRGTVYVVNGNSGSKESDPNLSHPAMFTAYGCDTCVGSLVLDFSGPRVDGYHIDGGGVERDHFTIEKKTAGLGTPEPAQQIMEWTVSPNPFTRETEIRFTLQHAGDTEIFLTDGNGKRYPLARGHREAGTHQLTVDADRLRLAAGAYTLFIAAAGKPAVKTVIKM